MFAQLQAAFDHSITNVKLEAAKCNMEAVQSTKALEREVELLRGVVVSLEAKIDELEKQGLRGDGIIHLVLFYIFTGISFAFHLPQTYSHQHIQTHIITHVNKYERV